MLQSNTSGWVQIVIFIAKEDQEISCYNTKPPLGDHAGKHSPAVEPETFNLPAFRDQI